MDHVLMFCLAISVDTNINEPVNPDYACIHIEDIMNLLIINLHRIPDIACKDWLHLGKGLIKKIPQFRALLEQCFSIDSAQDVIRIKMARKKEPLHCERVAHTHSAC